MAFFGDGVFARRNNDSAVQALESLIDSTDTNAQYGSYSFGDIDR